MIVGVGVDIVGVERFRAVLARTPGVRDRLFTITELAQLSGRRDPVPSLAARFAAREAAMKALGVGLGAFGFHELWVDRAPSGAVSLVVEGAAARIARAAGVARWHLSIAHDAGLATAHVLAESA